MLIYVDTEDVTGNGNFNNHKIVRFTWRKIMMTNQWLEMRRSY
jgi:hypothetical protein